MNDKDQDFKAAVDLLKRVFYRVDHFRKIAIHYNNPDDYTDYLDIRYYNDDYCYGIIRVNNAGAVEKIDLDKYAENGLDEEVYKDAMLEMDADYDDIKTDNPWESAKALLKGDKVIVIDDGEIQKQKNPDHLNYNDLEKQVAEKVVENTEVFPAGATLGEPEEVEDFDEEIETYESVDVSKVERVVRAGVVTEDDINRARMNGKMEERPIGTGWVEVVYRLRDGEAYEDIAAMYVDSRGEFESSEDKPYLDKKYVDINYRSMTEEEVETFKEVINGREFNDFFKNDYDQIDKNNPWDSVRAFIRRNNLPISYKEDNTDYTNEEQKGFGSR